MATNTHIRIGATALRAALAGLAATAAFAGWSGGRTVSAAPAVRTWTIHYAAHDGRVRSAYVVLPAWYGPARHPRIPLVISPHGRGIDGRANTRLWGDLPAAGGFAVVNPDGEGRRLGLFSWGYPAQIADLARMPAIVRRQLPWLRIDPTRVYAVGGSMGGQETLLLVARYPHLLAGAVAVDSVTDLAAQYRAYPRLNCAASCLKNWGRPVGDVLQQFARDETGGSPTSTPAAYAARSPLDLAPAIAHSCVPLQLWWSVSDLVVDSRRQSEALFRRVRELDARAPVAAYYGFWIHTAALNAARRLPLMLAGLGLLPRSAARRPSRLHYVPARGDRRECLATPPYEDDELGNAGHMPDSKRPKLTANFGRESYARGDDARLVVLDSAPSVSVQIRRAGTETEETVPNDVMLGSPVGPSTQIGAVDGRRTVRVRIGDWPSGVYFAQLTSGDRVGFAPFILRPTRLGEHRIAVVLPTETWQAYNFRDDNGDGTPDTWYYFHGYRTAQLIRPFLDRGVPPHWKYYEAPFVRWLVNTGRNVDYLSDAELRRVGSGGALANAYTAMIFPGHQEYLTNHEFDVMTQYRNLGGNMMFLAANDFFWKIELRGTLMTKIAQFRHLGKPEAALIGVGYRGNDRGEHRGPWIVRRAEAAPWLFAGTDLHDGDALSSGGIEIDETTAASPANVRVLAEIPNLFGPGFTAQMTYYQTRCGAKVFAAGAFSLAGSVWEPQVEKLMENLWSWLSVA